MPGPDEHQPLRVIADDEVGRPRSAIGRMVADWTLAAIAGVGIALVAYLVLPEEVFLTVVPGLFAFGWVPVAALWISQGSTVIAIGLWLVPSILLSAAWVLGAGLSVVGLPILVVNIAVILISFVPSAWAVWNWLVTNILGGVLRISLGAADREIEFAAVLIWQRLGAAAHEAQEGDPERYASNLAGIRLSAEDLPQDDLGRGLLRRRISD